MALLDVSLRNERYIYKVLLILKAILIISNNNNVYLGCHLKSECLIEPRIAGQRPLGQMSQILPDDTFG